MGVKFMNILPIINMLDFLLDFVNSNGFFMRASEIFAPLAFY